MLPFNAFCGGVNMYDLIIRGEKQGIYSVEYTTYGAVKSVMFNYNPYWGVTRFFKSIQEMETTIEKEEYNLIK